MATPVTTESYGPTSKAATMAVFGLFLRELATRARILVLSSLGLLMVLLGLVARFSDDGEEIELTMLIALGLGIIAPIISLVMASATIGERRADQSLVYLWLRPIPFWTIAVGAGAAAITVAMPIVLVSLGLSVLVSGEYQLFVPALIAGFLAVVGYTGIFLPLGALLKRSFLVGLGYILIWESLLSQLGNFFEQLSILSYSASIVVNATDVVTSSGGRSTPSSTVIPPLVLLGGIAITVRFLNRREID